MARAIVAVTLEWANKPAQRFDNLEHKDVDYNVSVDTLKSVYNEKLRAASREAARDGVGFLDIGNTTIPITLNDFPTFSVEITTISKE